MACAYDDTGRRPATRRKRVSVSDEDVRRIIRSMRPDDPAGRPAPDGGAETIHDAKAKKPGRTREPSDKPFSVVTVLYVAEGLIADFVLFIQGRALKGRIRAYQSGQWTVRVRDLSMRDDDIANAKSGLLPGKNSVARATPGTGRGPNLVSKIKRYRRLHALHKRIYTGQADKAKLQRAAQAYMDDLNIIIGLVNMDSMLSSGALQK